jgi:phage tail sheath protein FI
LTQTDIDNGRLIRGIGMSPPCPAEFAIFRQTHSGPANRWADRGVDS